MKKEQLEILEELFFISSYDQLTQKISLGENELNRELLELFKKGKVKCYKSKTSNTEEENLDATKINKYYYVISKKGLQDII